MHGVAQIPVGKAQNQGQNGLKCIGHQGVYMYICISYIYLYLYLCVNTAAQSTLGKVQNRAQTSM